MAPLTEAPMDPFDGLGLMVGGIRFLTPEETLDVCTHGGAILADVREEYLVAMKQFQIADVVEASHIDLRSIEAVVPRDRPLVLVHSAGVYTKDAARWLVTQGYRYVACLNGGMLAWDNAGMPVITDQDALLHGDCACVMRSRKSLRSAD